MKPFSFQMAVKTAEKSVNAAGKNVVTIEGFASTPDIDRYNDIVEPTAFTGALEMYMKNPVLLRSHQPDVPVGTVSSAIVTDKGLKVVGEINDEQTQTEILDGRMRAMSIGYIPLTTELRHKDGSAFDPLNDSPWDSDIVRVIKTLDLVEISIVSTPAQGNALFTIAESVKKAFQSLAYKGMGMIASEAPAPAPALKDGEAATGAEAPAPAAAPVEEAKPENDNKPDEEADADEPAPEPNEKPAETPNAEKPAEDAEKAGEKPAADGGEAPAAPAAGGEAPNAEAKPQENAEGAKQVSIDAKMVEELTALMKGVGVELTGLIEAEKATEGTVKIPDALKTFIVELARFAAKEYKRAEELTAAAGRSIKVHGQFDAEPSSDKKETLEAGWLSKLLKT